MQLPAMADRRHAGEHPTLTPPDQHRPISEDHTYPSPTNFLIFSHGPDLTRPRANKASRM